MDVNLTLSRMRDSLRCVEREEDGTDDPFTLDEARNVLHNLAESARALDEWLSKGGFLPTEWERPEE